MNENKDHVEHYSSLRKHVESVFGRPIQRSSDFDRLSEDIFRKTGEPLSVSTLKRFWGYIPSRTVLSLISMDILSRYAGAASFSAFCAEDSSLFLQEACLSARAIPDGALVEITWDPGRKVLLRHLGEGEDFVVVRSCRSKLREGDLFSTADFILNNPLYIGRIRRGEELLPPYVAGVTGGLTGCRIASQK